MATDETKLPELPDWPKYKDFAMRHGPTGLACEFYNHARYEAALARLRVAVEALDAARDQCIECNGTGEFRSPVAPEVVEDCEACAAQREALSLIGEVPE